MCIKLGLPTKEKVAYKLVFQEPDGTFISISTGIEIKPGKVENNENLIKEKTTFLNSLSIFKDLCWASPFDPDTYNPDYIGYTSGFKSHSGATRECESKMKIVKITFKGRTRSSQYDTYHTISGKEIKSVELVN